MSYFWPGSQYHKAHASTSLFGGNNGVVQEREDVTTFKGKLFDAFKGIDTPGSFASFGELPELPSAGLSVNGVGDITMPLDEPQARRLIARCRQAPYGKGSDTIVDTSSLCTRVAKDLGIGTTIRAEIYKMLIYEKGAMFKAHTDFVGCYVVPNLTVLTQHRKIPGIFGTLVISLPSEHQGGEVVVKHCGEQKIFKASGATQSYVCWCSDASYEVLPVISGYRWVLTYNLAIDLAEARPSASMQQVGAQSVRRLLQEWLADDKGSRKMNHIYHVLDHDYTEANASLKMMKARDLAQAQALKAKEGQKVAGGLALDPKDLVDKDCFADITDEHYEEYMGNSGPSATHWYCLTAVLLVPRDSIVSFLTPFEHPRDTEHHNLEPQFGYFARLCLRPGHHESLVNVLEKIHDHLANKPERVGTFSGLPETDGEAMCAVLKAAIRHERFALFEKAAAAHNGLLPMSFFAWTSDWLTSDTHVEQWSKNIEKGLFGAISRYKYFSSRVFAIAKLVPIGSPISRGHGQRGYVLHWARGALQAQLDAGLVSDLDKEDGFAWVELALYYSNPLALLQQHFDAIHGRRDAVGFYLGLMDRLMHYKKQGTLPAEESMLLYRNVARYFIESTDFTTVRNIKVIEEANEERQRTSSFPHLGPPKTQEIERRRAITEEDLLEFCRSILDISTPGDDLWLLFTTKLLGDVPRLQARELCHFWMRFMLLLNMRISQSTRPLVRRTTRNSFLPSSGGDQDVQADR
ncbi:hypothetical protein PT974_09530 [Cladobotryum mycophilum]|uniref:Prolyl 4-hydroxylase alpha subunit Fe(2+) 2OG dioxygenase domain-containing protein n=1 Tax=Cladobotryum mycophilum TaxID=491253 RepID=A0ABR0SGE0_9HYPO